ncbi:MAG: SH3 domain-containing protein [Proteobacteria bacterium]|nr:SH3 domain-containing protein [Pseudomonadota bacterium]
MPKFIIFSVCFLFITNIFAENGDELTITGDIVNLRSDPASDTDALIKLLKGRKVIEIQRQDDWVEIETHRKDIKTGWVHKSLVAKETEKLRTISISPLYKRFMK